jgi:hypothetical protein
MSPLTLPGRPGLLRHCSPVLAPVSKRVRAIGRRAIVIGEHLDSGGVLLADGAVEAYEDLALDLSDPTGRAHAAWWLADQPGNESVVSRRRESPRWMCCPGASNDPGDRLWHLTGYGCAPYRDAFGGEHDPRVVVPALAALNPNDPRLLPDGSRWVDAEALRLVCLHVAGLSP